MNSDHDIIERALATIPADPPRYREWARSILDALVPIVTQASLTTEEDRFVPFSIAVVEFPNEYTWEGFVLDGAVDCTPANLAKLGYLSTTGTSYLTARLINGKLKIVGVGTPHTVFGIRLDSSLAFFLQQALDHAFIAATVLGPGTILIEGFKVELAFVQKGQLQPAGDFLRAASFTFCRNQLRSDPVDVTFGGRPVPPAPMREVAAISTISDLSRGAWFARKGALFAFCGGRGLSGISSAHNLSEPYPLLQAYLTMLAERGRYVDASNHVRPASLEASERDYINRLSAAVRSSALDGAVIFDNRFRLLAFGGKLRSRPLKESFVPEADGGEPLDLRHTGTRHLSAASWVAASRLRMAVVVSQDGSVRVFGHDTEASAGFVYISARPTLFE